MKFWKAGKAFNIVKVELFLGVNGTIAYHRVTDHYPYSVAVNTTLHQAISLNHHQYLGMID